MLRTYKKREYLNVRRYIDEVISDVYLRYEIYSILRIVTPTQALYCEIKVNSQRGSGDRVSSNAYFKA